MFRLKEHALCMFSSVAVTFVLYDSNLVIMIFLITFCLTESLSLLTLESASVIVTTLNALQ